MKTLIKNGRVVDPSQNLDAVMDVLIEDGVVAAIDSICASRALKQKKILLPAPWQQRQAA